MNLVSLWQFAYLAVAIRRFYLAAGWPSYDAAPEPAPRTC